MSQPDAPRPDGSATGARTVRFASGQSTCEGWLYIPAKVSTSPGPAVVMAHGMGGTKAQGLAAFAERFCEAGYVVLAFDYRHFGGSQGDPRDLVDVPTQLEDWRSAVSWTRSLGCVDPAAVCVWGTSFGGGHAIVTAAADPGVAAVIAQVPFTSGIEGAAATPPLVALRLTYAALTDRVAARRGRRPVRVPLVGAPGDLAVVTAPEAVPGLAALTEAFGEQFDPPQVPSRIVLQILRYAPGRRVKELRVPVLFCLGQKDAISPPRRVLRHARKARESTVRYFDCDHFGIHLGPAFREAVADQVAFLAEHLPPPGDRDRG